MEILQSIDKCVAAELHFGGYVTYAAQSLVQYLWLRPIVFDISRTPFSFTLSSTRVEFRQTRVEY